MTVNYDNIGVLVLAAGFSRRFEGDKRKALFNNNQTLLQATLASVPDKFTKRTVVLRKEDEIAEDLDKSWHIVFAEHSAEGMGESLAAGIKESKDWSGALIALGDMPFITADTWEAVVSALSSHDIVQPVYKDQPGHPVGFTREFFNALAELKGDEGARRILKQEESCIFRLVCNDEGIIRDVDTPEDL